MFNASPLCIQSVRMLMKKRWKEFLIQALSKQYVELLRAVILKKLDTNRLNPYFSLQVLILSISMCLQN